VSPYFTAKLEGAAAYELGKAFDSNPHLDEKRFAWAQGWQEMWEGEYFDRPVPWLR